jgi:hypothetical protein
MGDGHAKTLVCDRLGSNHVRRASRALLVLNGDHQIYRGLVLFAQNWKPKVPFTCRNQKVELQLLEAGQ